MSGWAIFCSLLLVSAVGRADDPPPAAARAQAPDAEAIPPVPVGKQGVRNPQARIVPLQVQVKTQQIQIGIDLPGGRKSLLMEPKQTTTPVQEDDDAPQPVLIQGVFQINNMAIASQTFDAWVFAKERNLFGWVQTLDLKDALKKKAEVARSNLHLDEAQYQKLLTAGSGDIQRFLDRVEDHRDEFEAVRHDFNAGLEVLKRLEPLAAEFKAGPFGDGSLFAKTLHTMTAAPTR